MDAHRAAVLRPARDRRLLDRLRAAAEAAGLFDELATAWLLLDAELLPWSAKAGQLLRDQYAAVGAAARGALPAASRRCEQAAARLDVSALLPHPVAGASRRRFHRRLWALLLADRRPGRLRLAPFQVLARKGPSTTTGRTPGTSTSPTGWPRPTPAISRTTRRRFVDTTDPARGARPLTGGRS